LRGLKCPLPAMRTEAAVNRLAKGQKIEVLTTDPMSAIDVPHAARKSGGRVLRESRNGDVLVFEIARED
jgi:tRNA 2-thiouridine synthesizing protein A